MFLTQTYSKILSSTGPEKLTAAFIPTIYEQVEPAPTRWEYHLLTVVPAAESLPDLEQLNALGADGWIMAGLLHEKTTGDNDHIHYYFMRQLNANS